MAPWLETDWSLMRDLLLHFGGLSLMSLGGFLVVIPEMQRYLVIERSLLSPAQLAASIAIGQAAPGPNVQLVAVIGWQLAGALGAAVCMLAAVLPSVAIAWGVHRLGTRFSRSPAMPKLRGALLPISLGLMVSAGSVVASTEVHQPLLLAIVPLALWLSWRFRLSPILIVVGAGLLGLVLAEQGWIA